MCKDFKETVSVLGEWQQSISDITDLIITHIPKVVNLPDDIIQHGVDISNAAKIPYSTHNAAMPWTQVNIRYPYSYLGNIVEYLVMSHFVSKGNSVKLCDTYKDQVDLNTDILVNGQRKQIKSRYWNNGRFDIKASDYLRTEKVPLNVIYVFVSPTGIRLFELNSDDLIEPLHGLLGNPKDYRTIESTLLIDLCNTPPTLENISLNLGELTVGLYNSIMLLKNKENL